MAQARQFHRQQSLIDFNPYDQRFPYQQFASDTSSGAAPSSRQLSYVLQAQAMAQPILQQYSPETHSHSQQWQTQQGQPFLQDLKPATGARPAYAPSNVDYTQAGLWEGAMFNRNYNLQSGLCMAPYVMAGSEGAVGTNGSLMYPEAASQGVGEKDVVQYSGLSPWTVQRSNELPSGLSVTESDPESISSLSPKSYTSETVASDVLPFTPDTLNDGASSSRSWARYNTSIYPAIKASSPEYPVAMEDIPVACDSHPAPINLGTAGPSTSAGANLNFQGLPSPYQNASQFDSDFSYSQKSSLSDTPMYPHGMPYSRAVAPCNSLHGAYRAHNRTPHEVAALNGTVANASVRGHFQVPRPMDAQTQRRADDDILLEGKRNGLTYKEIRKKMAVKCAESTLRGRYRSLTKARKDRVRKPTWTANDLRLMNQYVQEELDRIDAHQHHGLAYDQRLAKVPWKKVADKVHANGGTYHFGNSTCKRKYVELHPSP